MPRILITGAAGFLGSHLCDRFIAEGYEVVAMDNLITGDLRNLEHLQSLPQFSFVHHDVSTHIHLNGPLDYILHFASPASPIDYLKIPIQTLKVGSLGTHNCLGLALAKNARILVASTSEVYGDPLVHPQTEEYWGNVNPIGVRSCYDEGKRIGETLCADFTRLGRVDARLVRIFNTYGPYMRADDGRVVTNFIAQVLRGQALTLYGAGKQTRSFCYADDLIEGLVRMLAHPTNPGPINLGNPHEFTMLQLAEEVQRIAGTALPLKFEPLPQDDPRQRQPDIDKARRLLGWEPQVPLAAGLARTIDYFRALGPR